MKFNFRESTPLIKMMWKASKKDLLAALPWFPIFSLAEVLLAFGSSMLLQLLFLTTQTVSIQSLIPGKFKDLFESSFMLNKTELIFIVPTFIAVVALIKLISRFMSSYLTERAGHRTSCYFREKMLENFLSSTGNTIDQVNPDHVANQLMQDSILLQSALNKGTMSAVRDSFVLVFIVCSLVLISWKAFFIGIAIVVPMVFVLKRVSQKLNFYTHEGQKKKINIAARFLQSYQGRLPIAALRSQGRELSDLNDLNEDNYRFMKKSLFVTTFFSPSMEFIGLSLLAGVFYWRLNSTVDFEAVNYTAMIILVMFSFRYIKNIAGTITFLSDMQVVFKRVTQYFKDYTPSKRNPHLTFLPNYSKNAIIAQNVSYIVQDDKKILNSCSVHIPKGKKIAFVGESGAGKTTFLRSLAGLLIPSVGKIEISENYLMAFQSPYIYRGTTLENIIYNQELEINSRIEQKSQDLVRALSLAFTESGSQLFLNKKLGFLGEGLSGGEKARLALARILFRSPTVVFLDEPTANLDSASSEFFWKAIEKWKSQDSDHTVVAVSHLIQEIIDFDYCYVFENGKIVKEGIPRDILNHA